ncbi:hypothetical protein BU16DRAFT_577823 [Lophium mytilinum]|uniref:Uncharacterized protein n=1 Tax=Lophium mytilinum TaxID=390894 RepID=A0A6A6RBL1_9PEZI|nr:hypothetical protein BU16DRAFT_577823 [Lophium mytilinum]
MGSLNRNPELPKDPLQKYQTRPLTAEEFMKYHSGCTTSEELSSWFRFIPLIDADALRRTWPWTSWCSRNDIERKCEPLPRPPSLFALSFPCLFLEALHHPDHWWFERAATVDLFNLMLWNSLTDNAKELPQHPGGIPLLIQHLRRKEHLDLSPFSSWPNADIMKVLKDPDVLTSATTLDLSMCDITSKDLETIVQSSKNLRELIVMHLPGLSLASTISAITGTGITELFHSDLYDTSWTHPMYRATGRSLPDHGPRELIGPNTAFPVAQILHIVLHEDNIGRRWPGFRAPSLLSADTYGRLYVDLENIERSCYSVATLDVRDALATPTHLICALTRLFNGVFRCVDLEVTPSEPYECQVAGPAFALGDAPDYKVRHLPAFISNTPIHGPGTGRCHATAAFQSLSPGTWTVISARIMDKDNQIKSVGYAFVTTVENSDCTSLSDVDVIVAEASDFLDIVMGSRYQNATSAKEAERLKAISTKEAERLKAMWVTETAGLHLKVLEKGFVLACLEVFKDIKATIDWRVEAIDRMVGAIARRFGAIDRRVGANSGVEVSVITAYLANGSRNNRHRSSGFSFRVAVPGGLYSFETGAQALSSGLVRSSNTKLCFTIGMGQEHPIFVIARVKLRYRVLAVAQYQLHDHYTAPQHCDLLYQIFSSPANRALLRHDLKHAATLNEETWNYKTPQGGGVGPRPFPFILTCLVLGASCLPPHYANSAHVLRINTKLNEVASNDGITVLDITDMNQIRYCFVRLQRRYPTHDDEGEEEEEDKAATREPYFTPLKGTEYVRDCHDEPLDLDPALMRCNARPLISKETLKETWPQERWRDRADFPGYLDCSAIPVNSPKPLENSMTSLRTLSFRRVVQIALEDPEHGTWIQDAEMLPDFTTMARKALLEYLANDFSSKYPGGTALFRKAFRGEAKIDLSPFSEMPRTAILQLLEDLKVTSTATDLDLSLCNITGEDLKALASSCKILKRVVLMHMPQLDLKSAVAAIAESGVSELLHTDIFIAFLATGKQSAPSPYNLMTGPGHTSPVSQILRLELEERDTDMTAGRDAALRNLCDKLRPEVGRHHYHSPSRFADIRDACAPLSHVVCTIARMLRSTNFRDYAIGNADSRFVAASLAVGPAPDFGIRPLAPTFFNNSNSHRCGALGTLRYSEPGEWTAIVFQQRGDLEGYNATGFQYCFVSVAPKASDSEPHSAERRLVVTDIDGFLGALSMPSLDTATEPLLSAADVTAIRSMWNSEIQNSPPRDWRTGEPVRVTLKAASPDFVKVVLEAVDLIAVEVRHRVKERRESLDHDFLRDMICDGCGRWNTA